jgi:hypothetical protein
MNIPANATDLIPTAQTKGRHYIAFWISNTGLIKFRPQKHSQKLSNPFTSALFWGTWANPVEIVMDEYQSHGRSPSGAMGRNGGIRDI